MPSGRNSRALRERFFHIWIILTCRLGVISPRGLSMPYRFEVAMIQDTSKTTMRVLIVDDHPVVLSGCRSLFASDKLVRIEEAGDAKSGHRAFVTRKPDVTVT